MRLVIAALVTTLLGNAGCSAGLIAAGSGLVVAGGYTMAEPEEHCYDNTLSCGLIEEPLNDLENGIEDAFGATLIVTGIAMVIGGIVLAEKNKADGKTEGTTPEPMITTITPATNLEFEPEQAIVSEEASGATMAIRAKVENRLAIQASTMAARGNCTGVLPTMQRLAQLDLAMHRQLLATDAAVAKCFTQSERNTPGFTP